MTQEPEFMDTQLVNASLDYRVPFIVASVYLGYNYLYSKRVLTPIKRTIRSSLTLIMLLHNLLMALFSFHVFQNTFSILINFFKTYPIRSFIYDPNGLLWSKLQYYFWIFYISKYIEIIDTVIIHLNNRTASFLQVYHHSGAIICCWLLCMSYSHISWIFILFNSFVHSFMYLYYACTTLGIKSRFKRLITYMQIGQFIIGFILALGFIFLGDVFSKDSSLRVVQMTAAFVNLAYVSGLYVMFVAFAKETYKKKVD